MINVKKAIITFLVVKVLDFISFIFFLALKIE